MARRHLLPARNTPPPWQTTNLHRRHELPPWRVSPNSLALTVSGAVKEEWTVWCVQQKCLLEKLNSTHFVHHSLCTGPSQTLYGHCMVEPHSQWVGNRPVLCLLWWSLLEQWFSTLGLRRSFGITTGFFTVLKNDISVKIHSFFLFL